MVASLRRIPIMPQDQQPLKIFAEKVIVHPGCAHLVSEASKGEVRIMCVSVLGTLDRASICSGLNTLQVCFHEKGINYCVTACLGDGLKLVLPPANLFLNIPLSTILEDNVFISAIITIMHPISTS
jgi:hypothetical protein